MWDTFHAYDCYISPRERDREGVKIYKLYIDILTEGKMLVFPFMSYWWDFLLFLFKWCVCEGLCSKPFGSYLHLEPRIRQDRTCCLKLSLFRQFGSLPISYADLEMKSTERGLWRDDRAVSPSSWQSWSLMPLCLSLAVNLLSLQPITGCSCLLLIVSLKLKFVITYWCMASWRLWAWTALTALTAWRFPSLCLRCPVVKLKNFFSWSLSSYIFGSAEDRRPPPPSSCGVTAVQPRCSVFSAVTVIQESVFPGTFSC